ncbi:Putative hydrolase in cluster with formaldehyde/S-nitrosomycothiol reductase MscR [Rhodococcus wratislaviensis]|uniref:Hydrolase in cluster with formaldehyde/S-nitrosomycothiol reductase MscR n=1 Tax=Rhodococcus wratislaviensis TaxID=44752 RepID=A0A402CI94_RHOWR|nr:Putative hydrolase in cluster with formaldehyde/S-nitrosomycothiol reductase MscR [Rhodococcus wratislaviensis]
MSGKLRIERVVTDVGDRLVKVAICTHGHNDHVTAAPELAERLHAPVLLHPGATTGPVVHGFPDHHRIDPRPAVRSSRRNARPHRAW